MTKLLKNTPACLGVVDIPFTISHVKNNNSPDCKLAGSYYFIPDNLIIRNYPLGGGRTVLLEVEIT
jgi:hypothetical protein